MSNPCPECHHILPGGRKCHQPALHGKPLCIHHCRTRNLVEANRARKHSIALPPLEDRPAIQMSLDIVLAALGAGKINRRTAATYAFSLKIASDNFARMEQAPPPEPVEICRGERGDILAADEPVTDSSPDPTQPPAMGAPGLDSETRETTSLDLPDPTEPPKPGSVSTPPEILADLRNTRASQEYDPEPPIPPTKTELRQKRRQIERYLDQQREALRYWSTLRAAEREGEDPQLVINYIQRSIDQSEAQLRQIKKQQAPDPEEPDPPL